MLAKVSPSMMCADFLDLKSELDVFAQYKIDYLHMDIMDGNYVPNFTLGIDFCKAVASYSMIPLDYHLMVEDPDRFVDIFCQIKNSIFTFHPETSRHPVRTIEHIRAAGCKPSIAIDPAIPVNQFIHLYPLVDMVCVMTVNPGYAGQKLIPFCIDKFSELQDIKKKYGLSFEIEADGNVSWENIPKMINAGAEVLVVGTSSVFSKTESRNDTLERLYEMLNRKVYAK
ncbi:MAG: ribulose-phosphate 3-epimerase [Cytophagales bacterium]|nr:ribulose-phosphate 3-epimerase [Cytophagales bacterium]